MKNINEPETIAQVPVKEIIRTACLFHEEWKQPKDFLGQYRCHQFR